MNFKNKIVLITGGSAGIGRSTAILFAEHGAKVAVSARSKNGGEVSEEIKRAGGDSIFVQGDVSVESHAKNMVDTTIKAYGGLDILVNNAGIVRPGRVDELTEEVIDEVLAVNIKGTVFVSKYAVPELIKRGAGAIVNVASAACLYGVANRSIYSASKGAVVSLTKAMAMDYSKEGIRVNAICPGATLSPSMETRFQSSGEPDAMRASFIRNHPIGRLAQPEEIAWSILFAACDEASFMTGSIIPVDGGVSL